MFDSARKHYLNTLEEIRAAGLRKDERILLGPQGARITTRAGEVLNFCANNYLGLSSHPAVIEAAKHALDTHGFGMSSVRFICGTQDLHKQLEATSRASSAPTTRSSTRRASTRTPGCSRRCSARRTRSSATR
jgi:glycine C-acetyltransferase